MYVSIHTGATLGIECLPITVEVDATSRWPDFLIIGLGDTSIQEAKQRIRTAWRNSGLSFPNSYKIIINLSPADVRKEGASFDLPMALGMFLAWQELDPTPWQDALLVGELALDGTIRSVAGVLPLAIYAKEHGYRRLFVPADNAEEASIIDGISVFAVPSFQRMIEHATGTSSIVPYTRKRKERGEPMYDMDFAYIKGQAFAKRALEIAASGGHNTLLSGPPGSGKTLLARTLSSILPRMTEDESIEVTKMYSVAGLLSKERPLMTERPFRAPHHSASAVALVGGGRFPKPGEISLAHRGVLFLDEFPEFPRDVLETLRQPLEDGVITISRAQGSLTFPARFTLVASQNPCPCGFATDPDKACICTPMQVAKYMKKISGPLRDRIDLHVEVPRVEFEKLANTQLEESSATVRARVEEARARQTRRFVGTPYQTNSEMKNKEIKEFCPLNDASIDLLRHAVVKLHLSARSFHRIIKLARTIADLSRSDAIETAHIAEALQYRGVEEE